MKETIKLVTDLVKKEAEKLGDSKKVFIGGFSQGCAIALATFLLFKDGQLGGVVGLSGTHGVPIDWDKQVDLELKRKTKIFLYHGEADPMLPLEIVKISYEIFKEK